MKHLRWFLCCLFIAGFGFQSCEKDSPLQAPLVPESESFSLDKVRGKAKVRVMTRNVYVGTDVDVILEAGDPAQVPFLVAEAFQMLQSTNFSERAIALAKEIAESKPHLVGLQEISLIRMQTPGDFVFGGTTPAVDVYEDFLQILMAAIAEQGLNYQVAGSVENADVEMPMFTGIDGNGNPTFSDIRLTDYDVVLVRGNVDYYDVVATNYQATLPIVDLGIEIPRGYVALTAKIHNREYRFANTHLEPAVDQIKMAQAQELIQAMANETMPIIMVGDFNTHATYGDVYNYIVNEGYEDVWLHKQNQNGGNGYTAPHDNDLRNEIVMLDRRIDLIFVGNVSFPECLPFGRVKVKVVGDELEDRTPSGLWPSDHAGVVAKLHLKKHHR